MECAPTFVERMGRGDGVNLRSRFMPSVSEERAPLLAAVPMEQPAFFPYTEIEEVARVSLYFLLFKFLRGV